MIKVVNPSVELWKQDGYTLDAIFKHIARCARVCYQSTPKNNGESDYDFLKRTILRGKDIKDITTEDIPKLHLSVFEHGTVYLAIPFKCLKKEENIPLIDVINSSYSRYFITGHNNFENYYHVVTNMRVIIENKAFIAFNYMDDISDSFNYNFERVTLSMTTDIGTSRELNRHRCHSISEESTRYCRYTANKFGGNITVAKLPWIDYKNDESEETNYENGFFSDNEIYDEKENTILGHLTDGWSAIDWFLYGLQISNLIYNKCVQLGWTAQQAREILPLNTKTQVVHTAFVCDWQHFIDLRSNGVSGVPHPMAKELADKVNDLINATKCG